MLSALLGLPALVAPSTSRWRQAVYIEDTDAFGMTFYANYLRFYERAVCHSLGMSGCARAARSEGALIGVDALTGMRYSSPALLGDEIDAFVSVRGQDALGRIVCEATLVRASDAAVLNRVSDLRVAFRALCDGSRRDPPWAYLQCHSELPLLQPTGVSADGVPPFVSLPTGLALQADELGGHGALTMHTALRYFERQRTRLIGGPEELKLLQEEGINVVVGRVDRAELFDDAASSTLGVPVELRCRLLLRARNTIVVFEQWMLNAETSTPLARADITCLCMNASDGKMAAVPKRLRENLSRWQI
ncbi:hypothetical protein AB1Y20_008165 [Prymnesium parvum]|uniref:Thioesterase domain-containing protein n=1 Tax=Prymnesium parvum TaxID=97485 RepID=A0AB34IW40_PRYPA